MFTPVILAGGAGTRLWPLSRSDYPKQLLPLMSENSMLQETLLRLKGLKQSSPIVVCGEAYRFSVAQQMQDIGSLDNRILLEPEGRNTAPAITLAAIQATKNNEDPVLFVLPADHTISNINAFHLAIQLGLCNALEGKLVAFGITPSYAETGYGYIQLGEEKEAKVSQLKRFHEKPNKETAKRYLASGSYCWNSGMFMFKASRYLQEIEKHRKDIFDTCTKAMKDVTNDLDFIRVNHDLFSACPSESIDCAVMEQTNDAVAVSLDAGWSDIGSWSSLADAIGSDGSGNTLIGDVETTNVTNTFIRGSNKLITAVGIESAIIIDTPDALLVGDRSQIDDISSLINQMHVKNRPELDANRVVNRPWGRYEVIVQGDKYKVKRIMVTPHKRISLQYHKHRSEHWVIVAGHASVIVGEESSVLTANQSIYIPAGVNHRLSNDSDTPLEVIEVQTGSYLGEDDIVRLEGDWTY